MGPYLLGKQTSCWWRHETMGNIYYVEFNFLNLKCYVFKMFLPNFNRIEWKMEKQRLFQNRLFLALFILTWEKYDVIVTSLLIWFWFFSSQIVHPIWKYLRTKFEQSNFKDKGVMQGGWKTPPQCYNETKKPSAYRVKLKSRYAILIKIWKWLKLLNSVVFIKKSLVNQVYHWILSFWLTITVLQWMK